STACPTQSGRKSTRSDVCVSEPDLHRLLCWGLIGTAAITAVALFVVAAPYGRHSRSGWGPMMSARSGWIAMESPSALVFAAWYFAGAHQFELVPLVFFLMWQSHYIYRSVLYPLR